MFFYYRQYRRVMSHLKSEMVIAYLNEGGLRREFLDIFALFVITTRFFVLLLGAEIGAAPNFVIGTEADTRFRVIVGGRTRLVLKEWVCAVRVFAHSHWRVLGRLR